MDPAVAAFRNQIEREAAGHRTVIDLIENGQRFAKDGKDITGEVLADTRNRLSGAEAILSTDTSELYC